jgi:hypothetical protein
MLIFVRVGAVGDKCGNTAYIILAGKGVGCDRPFAHPSRSAYDQQTVSPKPSILKHRSLILT